MSTTDPWMTPQEAAATLGVVDRTILLYLQRNELSGERRGRRWKVARASVEAHALYRGAVSPPAPPTVRNERTMAPTRSEATAPEASAPPAAPPPTRGRRRAAIQGTPPPEATPDGQLPPRSPRREWTFHMLDVLGALVALASRAHRALATVTTAPPKVLELAAVSAAESARYGAAGFHAFVRADKARLYGRCREHLAMTAATLDIVADLAEGRAEGLRALAREFERCSPRIGALTRKAGPRDA